MANALEPGQMRVLDKTGDSAIQWDKNSPDEVAAAREAFNSLTAKGYTAYEASKSGEKTSKKLTEFDPDIQRLVMVPKVKGGYPTAEPTYE
ncbi:MAG: hypothetical protein JSS66_06795 [Armatimonadetes bacterium]|nr:hypothetical protein [Armatimonadota bacterium]